MTLNLPAVLAIAALALPLYAGAGGTVTSADGKASVERAGNKVAVAPALPIEAGDTLSVTAQSKVEVQFDDDSLFAIPGPAVLRVDEFNLPKSGPGRAVYTLVDGGVRTVTGRISKNPGDVYELHTDLAIVTVKGSAYTALRCRGKCAGMKPGLYVRAERGQITVANGRGKLILLPGQTAFVEAPGAAPAPAKESPFADPVFASGFAFSETLEGGREPPRIEKEPPVSP